MIHWFVETRGSQILFPYFSRCLVAGYFLTPLAKVYMLLPAPRTLVCLSAINVSKLTLSEIVLKMIAGLIFPSCSPAYFILDVFFL